MFVSRLPPSETVLGWSATVLLPIATEFVANACAPWPIATELSPEATAPCPPPTAVELSPRARRLAERERARAGSCRALAESGGFVAACGCALSDRGREIAAGDARLPGGESVIAGRLRADRHSGRGDAGGHRRRPSEGRDPGRDL